MTRKLTALLLLTAMLCACAGFSSAGETKVLKMIWFSDGIEGEVMQGLIDEYEAQTPGIEIEIIEVPYADLEKRIKTMIAAEEQPALARLTGTVLYRDYLVHLEDYLGEDFRNRFMNTIGIIDPEGHQNGITMESTAAGIVYNKAAFAKAGITVPTSIEEAWTWDEFYDVLKTVMEKGDVRYGLVIDKTVGRYINFMYQAGGQYMNDEMTEANFNTQENRNAIEYFIKLHKDGIVPSGVWLGAENPNAMFRSGQVACHIGGSWLITTYDKDITDFEWGVTYLPKGKISAVQSACKVMSAFKGTGVEKEAADFLEWLSRAENMNRYLEPNYFITSLVDQGEASDNKYATMFKVFADEIKANESRLQQESIVKAISNISSDVLEKITSVLSDEISVDEFLEEINDLVAESLADAA